MSYPTAPGPTQPTKRRGPLPWILGAVAIVLILCVGFVLIGALTDDGTKASTSTAQTTAPAALRAPAATDFKVTAQITEKTCYGKAGCAVTWQPVIVYSGPAIEAGQTWTVSYKVSGLESGTKVGTAVMGSTGPAKQSPKHGRTAAEDSKITITVVSVEKAD
jgi:hypothetical protein